MDESHAVKRLRSFAVSVWHRYPGAVIAFSVATVLTVLFPIQHTIADRFTTVIVRRAGAVPPPAPTWFQRQVGELPNWYAWLILAFIIYALSRRFPLTGPRRFRHALIHFAVACVLTLALTVLLVA